MSEPASLRAFSLSLRILLLLLPVVGVLVPRAAPFFLIPAIAPLLPLIRLVKWRDYAAGVVCAMGLITVGLAYSPLPGVAIPHLLLLPVLLLGVMLWRDAFPALPVAAVQGAGRSLLVGIVLAVLLLAVEYLFNAPLLHLVAEMSDKAVRPMYVYDRGLVILALLFWPLMEITGLRKGQVAVVTLASLLLLYPTSSQASLLGLLAGGAVYLITTILPARWSRRLLMLGTVATVLLMPLVPGIIHALWHSQAELWPSANSTARLNIWLAAAESIRQHPWLGLGIEATRIVPGVEQNIHAHNMALHIWVEFGAVGACLVAAGLLWLLRQMKPEPTSCATYTCWLTIACVSYGIWQIWWMSVWFLLICVQMVALRTHAATAKAV